MKHEATEVREEILALTGLRFVAAYSVFIFHIDLRWPLSTNVWVDNLISQGAVGMTIFFMLSGFILAYTYSGRDFSLASFYRNRFARIYPVYVAAALLSLPWLALHLLDGIQGFIRVVMMVLASAFMIQAWFPQMFSEWNNGAAWSLSAEAFFYLIFPFAIMGLKRLTTRGLWIALLGAYVLSVLPGASYLAFEAKPNMPLQTFYATPIYRLPEFIFGATLYLLRDEVSRRVGAWGGIVAVVVLGVYLCAAGDSLPIFVTHNWISVPALGIFMVSLMKPSLIGSVFSARIFVYGGKISYCFYSFQFVVIFGLRYVRDHFASYFPSDPLLVLLIATVILLAASSAGYHLIEEPCRKWIRSNGISMPPLVRNLLARLGLHKPAAKSEATRLG